MKNFSLSKKGLIIVLNVFLAVTIIFTFSACAQPATTGGETAAETAAGEQVTMTLWEWHTNEIPQIVGPLYKEFEEENNVKLVISNLAFGDLVKKQLLAAESGEFPDVSEMWAANVVPILVEKKALESLDPYMEKEPGGKEAFLDQFIPEYLTKYNGITYSLPSYVGNLALFYNKDLFEKAGIAGPPTTWDELVDTAVKLTDEANGIYGLALNGNDGECVIQVTPFIAQNGGRVGKVDGKIWINSPETVEALQYVVDLINKYKVVPSYTTYGYQQVREAFMAGKAAMIIDGSWTVPFIQSKGVEFDWGTSILPKGKMAGTGISIGDTEWGIGTNSKYKDLGWKFIKKMTNPDSNYFWIKNGHTIPVIKSVAEKDDIKNDPYLKAFIDQMNLGNQIDQYREMPPQLESALDKFKAQMQAAALGQKSVQEAMDQVASEWDALYKEWEATYGEYTR
ncbi:MAG: ABC transporter substrate-binding protein [Actinobacteria bacterium]|nr:ABC transporter substrate-binding protein [Actinomycetota bacterium]